MASAWKRVDVHTAPVHILAAVPVMVMSLARCVRNSATSGAVTLDAARSARNLVRLVRSGVPGSVPTVGNASCPAPSLAICYRVLHAV